MARPTHHLIAVLSTAALLLAGCGGGSSPAVSGSGSTPSAPPQPVIHANPLSLLPTTSEVRRLVHPVSTTSGHDQTLSPATLSSAFAAEVPLALRLASGTAELDVTGRNGTYLYVHVFLLRTPAGAQSLTATFLRSTGLRTASGQPSGAPGQAGEASSQSYGQRQVSYRYAFRDDNILSYVELDGPGTRYSLAQAVGVAKIVDQHIRALPRRI